MKSKVAAILLFIYDYQYTLASVLFCECATNSIHLLRSSPGIGSGGRGMIRKNFILLKPVFSFYLILFSLIHHYNVFCSFSFFHFITAKCSRHYDGRRIGVCHSANDHRQTVIRSSGENDWITRGLVLWTPIHRFKGRSHMD